MKVYRAACIAAAIFVSNSASAQFIGKLEFKPVDCKISGQCELVYDFGYIDPNGLGWQAKAGLKTDGASIPAWARPIVGGAWNEEFIRAAVIHDHYCVRTVRTRRATHRMFYDALIEGKVNRAKALSMYYAVVVGSHVWINLVEGQPCQGVTNCIQSLDGFVAIPDTVIRRNEAGDLQAYRPARFTQPSVEKDIVEATNIIAERSITGPEEVEELALRRHPNDYFLRNGDAVSYQGPSSMFPNR